MKSEQAPNKLERNISPRSVGRIKALTPIPRTRIPEPGEDEATKLNNKMERIKLETASLTAFFIPQIWTKMQDWIAKHPPGLVRIEKEGEPMIPISKEELIEELKGESSVHALNILSNYVAYVLYNLAHEWENEQEEKLKKPKSGNLAEDMASEAYKRYRGVLSLGHSNVYNSKTNSSEKSPGRHILGGFSTGIHMTLGLLKILEKTYQQSYGGKFPNKEELNRLIEGTRPLLLAMAQSDVYTLGAIQRSLSAQVVFTSSQIDDNFDPSKFSILEQGGNMFLEIRPEVLDRLEKYVAAFDKKDNLRTGCPALFAEGTQGKNVVSELYEWLIKLYKELYIETQDKFK